MNVRILGQYELIEEIGRGGMATVFRARHVVSGGEVAVKVLHPEYADDPDVLQRFENEARVAAKLNHPNIAKIHDFGRSGNDVYIAMELAGGHPLSRIIADHGGEGIAFVRGGLHILGAVAVALDYAHRQGVFHRDVKPSNVIVPAHLQRQHIYDEDHVLGPEFVHQSVKLVDFGIARAAGASRRTHPGILAATFAYVAPERAGGMPGDARSDIYSLAIMTFEMFAGRVPFTGATLVEVIRQHMHERPPSVRLFNPNLSAGFAAALERGMAKNPEARPATASAFVDSLLATSSDSGGARRSIDTRRSRAIVPYLVAGFVGVAIILAMALLPSATVSETSSASGATATAITPPAPVPAGGVANATQAVVSIARPVTSLGVASATSTREPVRAIVSTARTAGSPTPFADVAWFGLQAELDRGWQRGDWDAVVRLLDTFSTQYPGSSRADEKLYAGLLSRSGESIARSRLDLAVTDLARAESLLPTRPQARATLLALTPTRTALSPTATPGEASNSVDLLGVERPSTDRAVFVIGYFVKPGSSLSIVVVPNFSGDRWWYGAPAPVSSGRGQIRFSLQVAPAAPSEFTTHEVWVGFSDGSNPWVWLKKEPTTMAWSRPTSGNPSAVSPAAPAAAKPAAPAAAKPEPPKPAAAAPSSGSGGPRIKGPRDGHMMDEGIDFEWEGDVLGVDRVYVVEVSPICRNASGGSFKVRAPMMTSPGSHIPPDSGVRWRVQIQTPDGQALSGWSEARAIYRRGSILKDYPDLSWVCRK